MDRLHVGAGHNLDFSFKLRATSRQLIEPHFRLRSRAGLGWPDLTDQVLQHQPGVARDADCGNHRAADLIRVDIDLDVCGGWRRQIVRLPVGLLLLKARADADDDVRVRKQVFGHILTVMADAAGG